MQQVLASPSMHPSLAAFASAHLPISPPGEAERPALGRRLPRLDRPSRPQPAPAVAGPTFLDHLRRLNS